GWRRWNSCRPAEPEAHASDRKARPPAGLCLGARSVDVAAVAAFFREALQRVLAQRVDQGRVYAGGHAFQAAADVDGGALLHPGPHPGRAFAQAVLHVAAGAAVARPDTVQALELAGRVPGLEFPAVEGVHGGIALAEDQPVAVVAGGDARLEQGAQAGQPGAVADQQQRSPVGGRMEAGIAADAQVDAVADGGVLRQPARAQAEASVLAYDLAHQ